MTCGFEITGLLILGDTFILCVTWGFFCIRPLTAGFDGLETAVAGFFPETAAEGFADGVFVRDEDLSVFCCCESPLPLSPFAIATLVKGNKSRKNKTITAFNVFDVLNAVIIHLLFVCSFRVISISPLSMCLNAAFADLLCHSISIDAQCQVMFAKMYDYINFFINSLSPFISSSYAILTSDLLNIFNNYACCFLQQTLQFRRNLLYRFAEIKR